MDKIGWRESVFTVVKQSNESCTMVNTVRNEKSDYDSAPEDDLSVRRVVQQLSALLAAGLGLFALIAWISGKPQLAAFGQGMIPMAPSTAILFLVFGSIIFFHSLFPLSLRVNRLNQLLGWIGTLISLLLFALYLVRVKSSIEHFGFRIADTISGVSIGYMSPVTAICFAFTGLAILALLSSSSNRKWRFVEAYGLAAVVAMVNVIMIIAYLWGKPLFYGTSIIPPAIPTSLSFVMIGIAILLLSHQQASVNNDIRENTGINAAYFYIAMFTLAATGIITLGYLYIRNFEQQYRAEIDKQLVFVANAKTDGLLQWKHERLGNASVFYNNPAFVTLVSRYFDDSTGVNNQKQLHGWLAKLETYAEYDRVILLDTRYNNRMSVPEKNEPVDKPLIKQAIESMRSGQIGFVDFYLCENDHRVYLGIIVPIIDEPGNQRIGAIALCIDPEKQLYPTINKQFQLNRTGESILVRRDGDSVLFLNELKFRKDSALKMRVSIANHKEFPSVKAVLGQEGIVEGIDYRDMPVIAAVSAVPGTPWFLLDKIDQSEAYAPVRNRAWMTIGLVGLLLLGMAISLVFVWRQRRMQYYHEKSVAEEALRESHEVLQAILNSIPARVFWKDKNLLLLGCNTAFAKDAGFEKPEDILGKDDFYMGWRDQAELYRADDRMVIESGKAKLNIDEPQTTPSGEQIHLLTSKVPLRDADGAIVGVLGTYQDITELKDFERKLKIFSDAVEGANDGFLMSDINGRISYVNRSIEKYFGYSREELMGKPIGILSKNPEEAKDIFKTVNNEGKWDGEVLSVKKDGEAFLASLSVSFVTTQDNIPIGTMGILRDITERKKAEQALRENEQRLRGILDATPFPIALVDVEGNNIEYWSRSAVSLFGHTASSATEWYQKAYPDANYRREVIKRWNNAQERARISGQAVNAGEYRITCDNGSIRICELYAAFIADKLIVTFNDLAERKLAEEALRESEE
ncbi:MAG TPA: hypothetical protein DCZ43_09495, partial [candidate division Zixibacteria bacterium]|nr:hypothetical protein [candidate division Zixibacteria bacterium]